MLAQITHIQRMSVHDGPGMRSTIFFKGCNMRCKWCHNPETWKKSQELMFDADKCSGCAYCKDACKHGARDMIQPNRDLCISCGECVDACYTGASTLVGKSISIGNLLSELLEDQVFYNTSNGGVTLSGGEPLLQFEFVLELIIQLKAHNIHTAIETNLSMNWNIIEALLPYTELFMVDLKIFNDELHKEMTGITNENIKNNLMLLAQRTQGLIVRTPVIEGINDHKEEMEALTAFVKTLHGKIKHEFLPYHDLGIPKFNKLGKVYEIKGNAMSPDTFKLLKTKYL